MHWLSIGAEFSDLEWLWTPKCGVLWIFLAILGCDTSLHLSQGGTTELLLCDPDREFGICIL